MPQTTTTSNDAPQHDEAPTSANNTQDCHGVETTPPPKPSTTQQNPATPHKHSPRHPQTPTPPRRSPPTTRGAANNSLHEDSLTDGTALLESSSGDASPRLAIPARGQHHQQSLHPGSPSDQHQQRTFFQSVFSTNGFLGEGNGSPHTAGGSATNGSLYLAQSSTNGSPFLALPSQYPYSVSADVAWRRGSSSSIDSTSHTRRRSTHRGGRFSRLADMFDDDAEEKTSLMTYFRGLDNAYKRAKRVVHRVLVTMFVAQPKRPAVVCESDVIEQTGWVCTDFIVSKLVARDLMRRKTGLTPPNWPLSRHVIAAGSLLESLYPKVYSNLCRKLCLTMSSQKVVRNTLHLLLEVLFERAISWAKIVSMMSIAGLYAEECASQGHPDFIHEIVDTVQDFTNTRLLPWLVQQGGWDGFPLPDSEERNRLSPIKIMLFAGSASSLILLKYYFQSETI